MALQLRRGTNAQRLGMTPANGELVYVTDWELDTISVTAIDTTGETVTFDTGEIVVAGQQIKFLDLSQNGLIQNQVYYALDTGSTTRLSLTLSGAPVNITGSLFFGSIQFAINPTNATGAPVGTSVPRMWIGNGLTVGGTVASAVNLDDLLDVQIGGTGGVGIASWQHLQYDSIDQLWRNVSDVIIPGTLNVYGNVTLGDASGDTLTINASTVAIPNSLNFDSGLLKLDATNNRVGINNATPTQPLDVAGNGQFSGAIYGNSTANATTAFTGAIQTLGGIGIAKDLFVGGSTTLGDASGDAVTINASTVAIPNNLDFDSGLLFLSTALNYVGINRNNPSQALDVVGNGRFTGDIEVQGGDITTSNGNASLFNTTATTVNIANAGTTISIGAATGTTTINNTLAIGGSLTVPGDLAVNGGDITTTATTATVFNANATTVSAFGAGTTINIGAATGTTFINHNLKVANVISTDDTRNATNTTNGSIQTDGGVSVAQDIYVGGSATIVGDLTVNGTTTTINSTTLLVKDKNIEMGVVTTPTNVTADGGGIILKGTTDKTILYDNSLTRWVSNIGFNASGALIGNVNIAEGANDNTITTSTGNLILDAATDIVAVDASLTANQLTVDNVNINGNIIQSTAGNDLYIQTTTARPGTGSAVIIPETSDLKLQATAITLGGGISGVCNIDASLAEVDSNIAFAQQVSGKRGITGTVGGNDDWFVGGGQTGVDAGFAEISTGNNGIEPIYARQYSGPAYISGSTIINELTLLDTNGNTILPRDLTVTGNDIKSSTATAITLSGADVSVAGDLTVTGNDIKSSTATAITLSGANVSVAGDFFVENNGNAYISGSNLVLNNNDTAGANVNITSYRGVAGATSTSIRWNETDDRWQTTVDGSTFINIPNQALDTTNEPTFSSVTVDNVSTFNSQTTTTTALTPVSISGTTRLSQKAIIRIIDNVTGEIHMLEALAFYKGTTAYITTYAEMYSNAALATFTASISAGTLSILATPASTNSTTFTVARISLS